MKIDKKNKQLIVFFSIILLFWLAKDLFLKGSGGNNAHIRILSTDRIVDARHLILLILREGKEAQMIPGRIVFY